MIDAHSKAWCSFWMFSQEIEDNDLEIRIEVKQFELHIFFQHRSLFFYLTTRSTELPRIFLSVYLICLDLNMQLWRSDAPNSCQELNHPINIWKQNFIYMAHTYFRIHIVSFPNLLNKVTQKDYEACSTEDNCPWVSWGHSQHSDHQTILCLRPALSQ